MTAAAPWTDADWIVIDPAMTNVRTTEPRQRLKVHLPPESRRWLRAEAIRRGCSVTQVLRDLIATEIERRARLEAGR